MNENNGDNEKGLKLFGFTIGTCVGIVLGIAVGITTNKIGVWLLTCLSIGMSFGLVVDQAYKNSEDNETDGQKKQYCQTESCQISEHDSDSCKKHESD